MQALFVFTLLASAAAFEDDAATGTAASGDGGTNVEQSLSSAPDERLAPDAVKEVLRVLKALGKRVEVRDKRESALYDKFGDFCSHGVSSLQKSLKESQIELPSLHLAIVELQRKRQSIAQEMQSISSDQVSAQSALGSAATIRKDEMRANQKELDALRSNEAIIAKLLSHKVVSALALPPQPSETSPEDPGSNSAVLLQTSVLATLQQLSLSPSSTAELMELLQQPVTEAQQIQVFDTLHTTQDGLKRDIHEILQQEAQHETIFTAMEKAKKQELLTMKRTLQDKKERDAAFLAQLTRLKAEEKNIAAVTDESDKLVKSLRSWCTLRRSQHNTISSAMSKQVEILQSAAKSLLADGKVNLFRPATASTDTLVTFMQVASHRSLRGSGSGLAKVTNLVDSMIAVLKKDQDSADLKVRMCKDELQSAGDDKEVLGDEGKSKAADLASLSEQLESVSHDANGEKKAIMTVDWVVATATQLREKTHKQLATTIAQGAAAADVMYRAMNGLELYLKQGGTLSLVQQKSLDDFGFLTDSSSSGPDSKASLQSLQAVIDAMKSEVQGVKTCEAQDQAAYEKLLSTAKSSRRIHTHTLTGFIGGEASLSMESQSIKEKQTMLKDQLGLTDQLSSTLQSQCTKLLSGYEVAKSARKAEIQKLHAKKEALEASLS